MNNKELINLVDSIAKLANENTKLYGILIDIMKELSVIYPKHEIETLPAKVKEVVQRLTEAEEECRLREEWVACADNLVDYAHEFVTQLSTWGKGYDKNDKQIKIAEDAIGEYTKLKSHDG